MTRERTTGDDSVGRGEAIEGGVNVRDGPAGSDPSATVPEPSTTGANSTGSGGERTGSRGGRTDTGRRLPATPLPVVRLLRHPFVGIDPRRSGLAIAGLGALFSLHLVSVLSTYEIAGVRAETLTPAFDSLSAIVIVVSLVAVTAGPLAYAFWNGGPGLAAAIPLVPVLVGEAFTFRWVLDVDVTVAITAGAAGAALALVVGEARTLGTRTPWRKRLPPAPHALFVAVVCVASAGVVGSFVLHAPDGMLAAYRSFAVYWLVPVAVAGCYLYAVR